jgi:hypothetical protein
MSIRALTPGELGMIKNAKQTANDKLTEQRKSLRRNRKNLNKRQQIELENNLAHYYKAVNGKPVVFVVDRQEIYLDYDLLRKFVKSLDRQKYMFYSFQIKGSGISRVLVVSYDNGPFTSGGRSGVGRLFELPGNHRELLTGLPRIRIA